MYMEGSLRDSVNAAAADTCDSVLLANFVSHWGEDEQKTTDANQVVCFSTVSDSGIALDVLSLQPGAVRQCHLI